MRKQISVLVVEDNVFRMDIVDGLTDHGHGGVPV